MLCDLDGVLVDSHAAVERHWRDFAARLDLDADTVVRRAAGAPSADVIAELFPPDVAARHAAWFEALEESDPEGVVAIPGAADFVAGAIDGRFVIVTSCGRALAHHRLGLVGITPPRLMVTADDVEVGKPSPVPYLAGAAALGIRPAEAVVIEDSLNGAVAGKAAGASVIAVAGPAGHRIAPETEALADHVVPDVSWLTLGDGWIRIGDSAGR